MRGARFDHIFPVAWGMIYFACGLFVSLRFSPLGDLGVESDFFAELAPAAQRLAAGEFSVANYPFKGPVYSFVLVVVHGLGSLFGLGWYRSAVVLNLICAVISLAVLYRLVLRLAGRPAALCTALLTGVVYEFFIQAHKALAHVKGVVRPGGTIVLVAECVEGYGHADLAHWFPFPSAPSGLSGAPA